MDEDRDAVIEALLSLNATAKRCPRVIHFLEHDAPTAWDRRHEDLDALLDRLCEPAMSHG